MKSLKQTVLLTGCCVLLAGSVIADSPAKITVAADQPGHKISPTLWGIFFEDINLSADGGLYPELVRNRSFEDSDKPDFWRLSSPHPGDSTMAVDDSRPLNTFNTHSLRVNVNGAFTLENEGYWGMNIVKGDGYKLKLAARAADDFNGTLTVKILSSSGKELASGEISGLNGNWRYHTLDLTASDSDPKSRLQISSSGKGTLFLDMVSLLPDKTWKDHGLRTDLAESLDALHPAFMRFPGGNWIEGDDLAHMYHWKYTIGNIDARTPLWNTWGYNTTQGLGFHEYLQLCEDLGAEPLFDINVGMSLRDSVPLSRMGQWIQDALDAIEYANGPTNSVWGGLRAKAGHPAPFNLKYMEIGNENGGPDYVARWPLLVNAIRDKYPYMQLIVNSDLRGRPYPKNPRPDIVDEHYYETPESFMRRATQYDSYDRSGPKIFIGEYAVTQNAGLGNLRAALGEAAFMTGMERNSDIVELASYAPLFVNMNHRAWNPDLINFDSSRWYGLPSYYVQKMFSENRGDMTLPIHVDSPMADLPLSRGKIGVGTWNTQAEFKDAKVTAPDGEILFASDFTAGGTNGWQMFGGGNWDVDDGALRQNADGTFIRAITGDRTWTNYTYTVKARKLGGREGFLILFHISGTEDRTWWNIGGWLNTQNGVEIGTTLDPQPAHIETNRWYDIRIEVNDDNVKCYLDGQLVHDVNYVNGGQITSLYASAATEEKSGDVIVKIVNANANSLATELDLTGAKNLTGKGSATVLTSQDPTDENSLDEPAKVSPKTEDLIFSGTSLNRAFPGNSFTVLRLQTRN